MILQSSPYPKDPIHLHFFNLEDSILASMPRYNHDKDSVGSIDRNQTFIGLNNGVQLSEKVMQSSRHRDLACARYDGIEAAVGLDAVGEYAYTQVLTNTTSERALPRTASSSQWQDRMKTSTPPQQHDFEKTSNPAQRQSPSPRFTACPSRAVYATTYGALGDYKAHAVYTLSEASELQKWERKRGPVSKLKLKFRKAWAQRRV
jgi:hypothetical protein